MKAQIVSFHCVLRDKVGKVLSSTFNQDVITQTTNSDDLLKGLADGLQNLKKGEKRQIYLSAEQAYGFYDPALVIEVSRNGLSKEQIIQSGHEIVGQSADGKSKIFRVVQASGDRVVLDGNHPLAGQDLHFDIEATEARDATSEELEEASRKEVSPHLH